MKHQQSVKSTSIGLCAGAGIRTGTCTDTDTGNGIENDIRASFCNGIRTGTGAAFCIGVVFAAFFFLATLANADVLTLNNGDELFGKTIAASTDLVSFEVDGKTRSFTATEVMKLEFDTLRMPPGEDKADAIKDALVQKTILKTPSAEEFPEANLINVLDEDALDILADGTWTHSVHRIFVVLKEAGRNNANHAFPYFPDLESFNLEFGRAITPGKTGLFGLVGGTPGTVRYVTDRTIADESDFATLPLYQRRHTVKFAIPEVGPGTIVEWKYSVKRNKLDPMLPFFAEKDLRGMEPHQVSRLLIRVPAGKKLLYKTEERGIKINVEEKEENGIRTYVFETRDVPAIIGEPNLPSLSRIAPRVACSLTDDWSAIATAYEAQLRGLRDDALKQPLLQAIVDRETKGVSDPIQKARKLFVWLGKEITTVGVSPQAFTFKPHAAAILLEKKQANLIDLGFLYDCFLTKAGVEHRMGLVRILNSGEFISEVPGLGQTGVLAVEIPGASGAFSIALPVGDNVGPDIRLPFLQGAQGVVIPDGKPLAVPFCPPEDEGESSLGEGNILPDGTLAMKHTLHPRGNSQASMRQLKNMRSEEIKILLENNLHEQFPGARLKTFAFQNLGDVNLPLVLDYEFEVPDFALKSGDDLLVIPVPVDRSAYSARTVGAPTRLSDMAWDLFARNRVKFSVKLPPGFTLHALPEGVSAGSSGMWYASSLGFSVDTFTFQDLFERSVNKLSPAEYPVYKRLMENRSEISNQWIVIRKSP